MKRLIKARCTLIICALLFANSSTWAQDWIYPIAKGETLWSLCLEYTNKPGCWLELGKYNGISKTRRIPPGSEIRIPVAWLVNVPNVASVVAVQGDVSYDPASDGARQAVTRGQALLLGSTLVAAEGSATIRRDDGSQILLRPGTELKLDSMTSGVVRGASTELKINQGEIEVTVPPESGSRFEVRTPSAIAAVRGTQYRLATAGEAGNVTRGEVLEGAVEVAAGSSMRVEAGYGVLAKKGEPVSEPRKLLAAPVFESVPATTFQPLTLQWNSDPGASLWRVDVYHLGQSGALMSTVETLEPEISFDALDLACYRFVVRAVDGDGFNGLQASAEVCLEPPPPVVKEDPECCWPGAALAGFLFLLLAL